MQVLAIPATNTPDGINRRLLGHVQRRLEGGLVADAEVAVEVIDLDAYEMPIHSKARQEAGGIPEPARQLFDKIRSADAIVISFAEHNGSYSAAWKNIYDWMSRIDMQVYGGRPVLMLAATPGSRGGAGVLGHAELTAPFFGADLVGTLGVGRFSETFDSEAGELLDPELRAELDRLLTALTARRPAS